MWLDGSELEIVCRHVKPLHDLCDELRQNLITRSADGPGKITTKTNLDILQMVGIHSVQDVHVRIGC